MASSFISTLYGELARQRRLWYARHPDARRRLARPVISIGSLTVGGSGKTPVVAHVAKLLLAIGERPAILSRGYDRQAPADGVVVVRDAERVRADLARAGDEPLMLARALAGASVLVSSDRYLAGRLAEARFGCSVHLLDDGFQHVVLERDLDLLVFDALDLDDVRLLPAGRMRERLETASLADAVLVAGASESEVEQIGSRLGLPRAFRVSRALGAPRTADPAGAVITVPSDTRVLAVAGIAYPNRFFDDLKAEGFDVVRTLTFRDHHPFSPRDVAQITRAARADRVDLVLTTEKDLVRLLPHQPIGVPLAWVPLNVAVEPAVDFRAWLTERLSSARAVSGTRP